MLYLAGGWLTSQALSFLQLNSEGNIKALKKFKDRFIKDLLVIGGILLATTVGFGKIFALVKGLGFLLTRVTFGGFIFKAFGGLGQFILNNVSRFINFIRRVGVGGLGRGFKLRNLLPFGFLFENRIARSIKNFFSGAGDDLMRMPFFKNMMDRFGKTGMGKGLDKFSKAGGFNKLLNNSFMALYLALETFTGKAELQQAGLKPLQAFITSFSRAFAQFALFNAFVNTVSFSVGGIFAGLGALIGSAFPGIGTAIGAAKGFMVGKKVGLALGVLGFFFPETMKKLTGGLIDIQKFQQKTDKFATDVGMRVSGVDEKTQKKVRGAVFDNNDNVSSDNTEQMEISSITVDKSESIDNSIVAFKREKNNLVLSDNTANIIDLTMKQGFADQNIAGGSDDKSGIVVPVIDSSNKNSDAQLIAIREFNLNVV